MKIGIDSYCYHRLFGEVYPFQNSPESLLTFDEFLNRALELPIDGLSLESCFFPSFDLSYLKEVKLKLDNREVDRVYAWGHPDGLEAGQNEKAYQEMIEHMDYAEAIGANVMRVVGSSHMFRFGPHDVQLEKLGYLFQEAVKIAQSKNIKLAVENHIDYNSDEILQLVQHVNSPFFGVNFDSGNFLRVLDDPIKAMEKLAPYVFATHIKDLMPVKEFAVDEWCFFSCVPTNQGLIDNYQLAKKLHDVGYSGFLAVEIDTLHPDYLDKEEEVVLASIQELKRITTF